MSETETTETILTPETPIEEISTAETPTVQKKMLTKKEVFSYAFGLFGFQIVVGFMSSYQASFINHFFGLGAAAYGIVGIIILVSKLASAVADPFIGALIDRTNSKHGKLKPFMAYSAIPLAIFTVLIFAPFRGLLNMSESVLYIYVFVLYFFWCIAMTVGDIPSQAMAAVMTTNNEERSGVISLANTFKTVGMVMPAVILPIITLLIPGGANFLKGKFNTEEYFVGAIACAVIGLGCFMLIPLFNKERVPYKAEKIGIRDMAHAMKDNKYLLLIFLSYIIGFGRMGAIAIPTQTAGALIGTEAQSAIVGLSTAIGGMVSMIITPKLVRKYNEKRTFIGFSVFHFIMSAICIAVSFSIGYDGWRIYLAYALLFFRALGCGAYYIVPLLMVADAVDYYEYRTGKRTEGISYAVNSFAIKVTMAMAAAVALLLVGLSGYSNTNTITVNGQEIINASRATKNWVYFAFCGFPGIAYLLSIIPILRYDLVGEKKQEILRGLAEKREKEQISQAE